MFLSFYLVIMSYLRLCQGNTFLTIFHSTKLIKIYKEQIIREQETDNCVQEFLENNIKILITETNFCKIIKQTHF